MGGRSPRGQYVDRREVPPPPPRQTRAPVKPRRLLLPTWMLEYDPAAPRGERVKPVVTEAEWVQHAEQRETLPRHGVVYDWCQAGDHRAHRNLMRWTEDGTYACRNHVDVLTRCTPALWVDPWEDEPAPIDRRRAWAIWVAVMLNAVLAVWFIVAMTLWLARQ